MLVVHYSNRLELLAVRLSDVLSKPAASPLSPEVIAVQNFGVARWLSLRLATECGIAANLQFQFPAELIWRVFTATLDDVPATTTYDAATLTWRLLAVLEDGTGGETLGPVAAYLADGRDFKRYGLAQRLAQLFEQYLVYRPDWIEAWEAAPVDDWQGRLWRALIEQGDPRHWGRLQRALLARAAAGDLTTDRLPPRLVLFAVTTLSPAYLAVIDAVARDIDVHMFVLNPCEHYWGDIVTHKDRARRVAHAGASAAYLETGNSLLASLGKQGRDFIDLLQELGAQETDAFAAAGEDCLLHRIQSDILALREPHAATGPAALDPKDRSVQVHVCHSPMREVEVLHDRLLDLFERNPALAPSDVIVMMPDLETYAPYVEAVFATRGAEKRIPFNIADRGVLAESALMDAFFHLLDLTRSRFDANTILGLLRVPAIQRRCRLHEEDLELIHRWVRETGIRWGVDATSRAALELPATAEHSWQAGMERLLLGYALPAREGGVYQGILPYHAIEGAPAQALGRLQTFLDLLVEVRRQLTQSLRVAAWADMLGGMLDRVFDADEDEEAEIQLIRATLADMVDTALRARYDRPVALEVMAADLRHRLSRRTATGRFLTGALTFAALMPMRSLPFDVVCLLGMNDGSFPRSQRPASFDRMAEAFRRGDRSRRQDDRYLFLETLISARQHLYISYVGRNIRDDSVIPPAPLVNELLDYIERGYCLSGAENARKHLVTEHPLQAFSPRYFTQDPSLFSYAEDLAQASAVALSRAEIPTPLFAERLADAEPDWRCVRLEDLVRFYSNPARHLVRGRLGIHLEESEGLLEIREPFALDRTATRQVRSEVLSRILDGEDGSLALEYARASGVLPQGRPGEALFHAEQEAAAAFAQRLAGALPASTLPPQLVDVSYAGIRLFGRLADVSPSGLVEYSVAKMTAVDWIRLWIRHLVLNAIAIDAEKVSRFIAEDVDVQLVPATDAETQLGELLGLYWEGMHRPLHFFPRTALAYATASRDRMHAALVAWQGSDYSWGECEDPYFQLVFAGARPLDDEFERLAMTVFGPLLDNRDTS